MPARGVVRQGHGRWYLRWCMDGLETVLGLLLWRAHGWVWDILCLYFYGYPHPSLYSRLLSTFHYSAIPFFPVSGWWAGALILPTNLSPIFMFRSSFRFSVLDVPRTLLLLYPHTPHPYTAPFYPHTTPFATPPERRTFADIHFAFDMAWRLR